MNLQVLGCGPEKLRCIQTEHPPTGMDEVSALRCLSNDTDGIDLQSSLIYS